MRDWLPLLLGVPAGIALAVGLAAAAPRCAVIAAPKVATSPVRYARVRVTIEQEGDPREARLDLIGPDGLERSSEIDAFVRTQTVEWPNVFLTAAGDYEVRLIVSNGCRARDGMIVQ